MARLLPICLVLVLLAALLIECEGLIRPNKLCCNIRLCGGLRGTKCCYRRSGGRRIRYVCRGLRCVRDCSIKGRDLEANDNEPEVSVPSTRDMEENNEPENP